MIDEIINQTCNLLQEIPSETWNYIKENPMEAFLWIVSGAGLYAAIRFPRIEGDRNKDNKGGDYIILD